MHQVENGRRSARQPAAPIGVAVLLFLLFAIPRPAAASPDDCTN